jgi:hypothetical protein
MTRAAAALTPCCPASLPPRFLAGASYA